VIPKQDRSPIRQAREIEQKYNLNTDLTAIKKIAAGAQRIAEKANSTIADVVGTANEAKEIAVGMSAQIEDILKRLAALEAGGGGSVLPSGYTLLEYIQSSGTQYIDTDFKPNQDTRVVLDFHNSGDYSGITTGLCPFFGARNASTTSAFALWVGTNSYPHYGNVAYNKNGNFTVDINRRLTYDFNKNVVSIGDTSITCASATFTTSYSLCLLTINNYGTIESRRASGKLYSCQIYDNGTLVRDFVPVISPDGAYGLYDKANSKFYGNAGSGAFTGA
jgi:hypothetical protein